MDHEHLQQQYQFSRTPIETFESLSDANGDEEGTLRSTNRNEGDGNEKK